MCSHTNTHKVNDVKVCLNCGMTVLPNGKIIFDRKITNYNPKKQKKKGGKK